MQEVYIALANWQILITAYLVPILMGEIAVTADGMEYVFYMNTI
jgi:hypothetical protein